MARTRASSARPPPRKPPPLEVGWVREQCAGYVSRTCSDATETDTTKPEVRALAARRENHDGDIDSRRGPGTHPGSAGSLSGQGEEGSGQAPGRQRSLARTIQEVHHLQPQVPAGRHDHPRLRLCRLARRGLGTDQGHGAHLARPGRLRPVLARRSTQLLRRPHRREHLRHHELHLGLPGEGHRLRR